MNLNSRDYELAYYAWWISKQFGSARIANRGRKLHERTKTKHNHAYNHGIPGCAYFVQKA